MWTSRCEAPSCNRNTTGWIWSSNKRNLQKQRKEKKKKEKRRKKKEIKGKTKKKKKEVKRKKKKMEKETKKKKKKKRKEKETEKKIISRKRARRRRRRRRRKRRRRRRRRWRLRKFELKPRGKKINFWTNVLFWQIENSLPQLSHRAYTTYFGIRLCTHVQVIIIRRDRLLWFTGHAHNNETTSHGRTNTKQTEQNRRLDETLSSLKTEKKRKKTQLTE